MLIKITNPYTLLYLERPRDDPRKNPCVPSPCGPNSVCRNIDNRATCACVTGMFGAPPNCRPECVVHQDCPSNKACINQKCKDPCVGACGFNAICSVKNHQPICNCFDGHEGDPYSGCNAKIGKSIEHVFISFITFIKILSFYYDSLHSAYDSQYFKFHKFYRHPNRNI